MTLVDYLGVSTGDIALFFCWTTNLYFLFHDEVLVPFYDDVTDTMTFLYSSKIQDGGLLMPTYQ